MCTVAEVKIIKFYESSARRFSKTIDKQINQLYVRIKANINHDLKYLLAG